MRRKALLTAALLILQLAGSPVAVRADAGVPPVRGTQTGGQAARQSPAASFDARWDSSQRNSPGRSRPSSGPVAAAPLESAPDRMLVRRSADRANRNQRDATTLRHSPASWTTSAGALVFVVLTILVLAALWKKYGPRGATALPVDVVEVLGKRPLDQRHTIHLIRCGSRLLIVGASADGLRTLSELTDPVEIDLLTGLCRRQQSEAGAIPSFRQLLNRKPATDHPPRRSAPGRHITPAEHARYGEASDLEAVHG